MSFKQISVLPTPGELRLQYPVTDIMREKKNARDIEIKMVLSGASDKFLIIIGPCSADNEDSLLEYTSRLAKIQDSYGDKLLIIPRVYSSKPRSNGCGYKGILHQPDISKAPDIATGIVLKEHGLSSADEMLYPENYAYVDDLLSYLTIGARSCEDQFHRFSASGCDIPCGIKNPTNGSIHSLLDSVHATQQSHQFIYRGNIVETSGNPYAHCILRGYTDVTGLTHPNYDTLFIEELEKKYVERELSSPAFIIDANHANSGKQYLKQKSIILNVLEQRNRFPSAYRFLKGFMVESYLLDGSSPSCVQNVPGLSLTDPCLGWEKTVSLLDEIYRVLKTR